MTKFKLRTYPGNHKHMVQSQVSVSDEDIVIEALNQLKTEKRRRYLITLRSYQNGECVDIVDLLLWDVAVDDLIAALTRQRDLKL